MRGSSARNVAALGSDPPLQVPLCCPLPVTSLLPTASARLGAHVGPLGRTPGSVQPPSELEGRLDQTRSRALPSSPRAPWNGRRACWLCKALGPGTPRTGTARGRPPGDSGSACPRRPGILLGLEPSQQVGLQRSGELGGRARHLPGSLQSSRRSKGGSHTPRNDVCPQPLGAWRPPQGTHKKTPWEGRSGQIPDPARWSQPPPAPAARGHGDGRHLGLSRLGASSSGWSLSDANTRQHTRRPTQQTVPGGIPL